MVHVAPPSSERYSPEGRACAGLDLSGLGLGAVSASTSAYTTFGSLGATAIPMRPFIVSGKPETMKGRIGIAVAPSDPKVVYALVEADTAPNPKPDKSKPAQARPSGLYRSDDGGATWTKMNGNDVRPFYYYQVRVDPKDPNRVYWSSTPVNFSSDGGKTAGNATQGIHVDHHAMWIDPNDPGHFIVGNDG